MTLTDECFINAGISHAQEYPQTPILFSVSVFFEFSLRKWFNNQSIASTP
jgi:hypothetical protein